MASGTGGSLAFQPEPEDSWCQPDTTKTKIDWVAWGFAAVGVIGSIVVLCIGALG